MLKRTDVAMRPADPSALEKIELVRRTGASLAQVGGCNKPRPTSLAVRRAASEAVHSYPSQA
jgi:hypothetical protein